MPKNALILILILGMAQYITGQERVNDPEAIQIINEARENYNALTAVETDFELIIEQGPTNPQTKKGKMIQQGNSYFMETEDQAIYIDGNSTWLHLKGSNEVQINDYEEEDQFSMLSPSMILQEFNIEDYDYMVSNRGKENKQDIVQISIKPLDENADFSKIRFTFAESSMELLRIKLFGDNSARYTLNILNLTTNQTYAQDQFVFNADKFPGIYIEDLRID